MSKQVYINRRDKEEELYQQLQKNSLETVQQLSSTFWTDYNAHDPGVTLLDALNYALLELDYAFESPFEVYLTDPKDGRLDLKENGLLPSYEIFTPVIVTEADYELVLSYLEGVRRCKVEATNSLYNITIYVGEEDDTDVGKKIIRKNVFETYHQYRNLCENLGEISFVKLTDTDWEDTIEKDAPGRINTSSENIHPPLEFTYDSIQEELPECYGIGERGLASDASEQRKAEVRQLKGYLLIFDYLLSGASQELRNIRNFLSFSTRNFMPFRPEITIPGLEDLLDSEILEEKEIFDPKEVNFQKAIFFDHLDMLYGEDTRSLMKTNAEEEEVDQNLDRRAKLIRRFPEFNTLRFRSFNLLDAELKSIPGIKLLANFLMGNNFEYEMSITNNFSRYNLQLITNEKFFTHWIDSFGIEYFLEGDANMSNPSDVTEIPWISDEDYLIDFSELHARLSLFHHHILFEGFLTHGMNKKNYRCFYLRDQSGYLLLYKEPGYKVWINLGFFFRKEELESMANRLFRFVKKLNRESLSFYLIEHNLLQYYIEGMPIEYHKLTVVIPRWAVHLYSKELCIDFFKRRLPAHLDIRCVWLGVDDIKSFERAYFKWRKAWASNHKRDIEKYSRRIKQLITVEE